MTRRTLALLVAAIAAVCVTTASSATAEPQELCIGLRGDNNFCVINEDGLAIIELPPIGTGRVRDLLNNG